MTKNRIIFVYEPCNRSYINWTIYDLKIKSALKRTQFVTVAAMSVGKSNGCERIFSVLFLKLLRIIKILLTLIRFLLYFPFTMCPGKKS